MYIAKYQFKGNARLRSFLKEKSGKKYAAKYLLKQK